MRLIAIILSLFLVVLPQATSAQEAEPPRTIPFGARAVAGTLGSAAGALVLGAVGTVLSSSCAVEDWGCVISGPILAGAAGSIVGSAAGTHLLARSHGEVPSIGTEILSASLGLLAGTLIGFGLMRTVSPDDERWFLVGFTITQGTLTAMGSQHSIVTDR